ncbi:hypothetical protein IQ06DRAFT_183583, partial [Phaeosphaeriaceae sp. SRC1lsM3a]
TLQELIAPRNLQFFDRTFKLQGTKYSLVRDILNVTGVDLNLLLHQQSLSSFSVAQKMSWAANRETTRSEDQAYSLLGLFDLNMPLLYGEGAKTFRRLQEEIIRTNADTSILAW